MKAVLIRNEVSNACVRGYLVVGGATFATLEPPWRHNVRNVSCIPAGEYEVVYLEKSASGKYRQVYHLQAIPARGGILIHQGNLVRHTQGCILIGKRKGKLAGQLAVLNSASAMRELRSIVGKEPFTLKIHGDQHDRNAD